MSFESRIENIKWACEVTFQFAKELGFKKYGIIQTNYFSGLGEQGAALYEDGEQIVAGVYINEVLKSLGVERTQVGQQLLDEFDSLNLGEYRDGHRYYWDTHNQAVGKKNMISGRIIIDEGQ